jgi:apolipoprotein N-acyltransferase
VWPETNFPGVFNLQSEQARQVLDFSRENDVTLMLGSNEYDGQESYYNSSFLVEPGTAGQVYRKRHLVAFGEYSPLRWILDFIPGVNKAVQRLGPGDFLAGREAVVFDSRRGRFAPIICWETVFGAETQDAVARGAEVIVLQTYDGWFGKSAAPYYLTAQAAIRAVESGRWVARAATTGISGFADHRGRFYDLIGLDEGGVSVRELPRLHGRTLYSRLGNWFVWLCLAAALFCGLRGRNIDTA